MSTATAPWRPRAALAAVALAASSVLVPTTVLVPATSAAADAPPPAAAGRKVIADGHIDMGPRLDHGRWTIGIRDDSGPSPVWRDPAQTVLQAVDAAAVTVPSDPAFSFLGQAGARVWLLPQVQQQGVLWPGWNSQDPSVVHTVDREVTWKLETVRGPGRFLLFVNESFGTPSILFDSARRLPQETGIETNSHVHGNWAFTKPGTYLLGIRMTARSLTGTPYDTAATLRVSVGPQDPRQAFTAGQRPASATSTARRHHSSAAGLWLPAAGVLALLAAAAAGAVTLARRRRARTAGSGRDGRTP